MVEEYDSEQAGEENLSDSQSCCPSDMGQDKCCSFGSGGKNFKTAIFVLVILLAIGVAAYSLLKDNSKTTNASPESTLSPDTLSLSNEANLVTEIDSANEQLSNAKEALCGISLDSIKSLWRMADEKKANVVFIFLAGENKESAQATSLQIEAAVDKLLSNGKQVAIFTLTKDAEGYDQLIKEFSVQSLPCVIVADKGCGAVAVSGEITEAKLLGAFVKASTPISCGPRSGSLCCPK